MSPKIHETTNPFNGEPLFELAMDRWADVEQKLDDSLAAYKTWSTLKLSQRSEAIMVFQKSLKDARQELANLITREMGKPITESLAEVDKCVQLIDFCVGEAPQILGPQEREGYIRLLSPQGIIYGVMPWNFPVWQTLRFCIPTMLAGNTVLVKPALNVGATGAMIQKIFDSIAALKNTYLNLPIDHKTSDQLIEDRRIRGVSFTGSSRGGKEIAAQAGKFLKKAVLELGGNDAYIIYADADIPFAAQRAFEGRVLNAGQSCISAKRFLVEASAEERFLAELKKHMSQIVLGDPLDPKTKMGPVARFDLQKTLKAQLAKCLKQGAEIYYQKEIPQGFSKGAFFSPTILRNVSSESAAFQDEIFGPIFSVTTFQSEDEAVTLANHSPYGLGGAVFSSDEAKTRRTAEGMDTGSVALNDFFRSAPHRPFGGVKDSGYGRELGPEGFLEFLNLKVLVTNT